MKVIHAENSLDLGEESRQELEISSGHKHGLRKHELFSYEDMLS
jgi:hypothetical protein